MGLVASLIILFLVLTSLDDWLFKAQDIILIFTLSTDTILVYAAPVPPYLYLLPTSLTYIARYDT